MHKILFLDVDGVLNCEKTWQGPHADGFNTLCPAMCDRLKRIVDETQAVVVLSSTWRLHEDQGLFKLRDWLAERNIKIHSHTKDLSMQTGWGSHRAKRGDEIQLWLDDHAAEFPPMERTFVIIDDDSDMLPSQKQNFVHTTFKDGLTDAHAQKAINILNQS